MDLATVQSDEDRAKLKEAADAVNCTSDAWIGFKRVTWRWSYQHTPISYKKWDSSQPDRKQMRPVGLYIKMDDGETDTVLNKTTYFAKLVKNDTVLIDL